jgi:polysaccharide chain length determinant protein (PEP-CTERM system associated)
LAGEEPILLPETQDNASLISAPEIDGRIDALKRNLDTLLQRYTDKHPDVVGARKIIAQLEEQKRDEMKARQKAGGGKTITTSANPVLQQLKLSLADAEANVAAMRARVAEYDSRYNALRNTAKQQPEVEAEFAQLNRDYDIQKKSYETLVARRESASMSAQMESSTGVADFRVIDPPRVSPTPVAPNRLLILPVVLLISLLAGAAVSFASSQIRPTVIDARGLRLVSGLAVLGSISMVKTEADQRRDRRQITGFFAALGGLLMSYGAAVLTLWLLTARNA